LSYILGRDAKDLLSGTRKSLVEVALLSGFRIERHCGADEILQGRLIDLVAFMDVDGAPGAALEAGVEGA
jgi:hypothetical protein